jgi:hypothetical protein
MGKLLSRSKYNHTWSARGVLCAFVGRGAILKLRLLYYMHAHTHIYTYTHTHTCIHKVRDENDVREAVLRGVDPPPRVQTTTATTVWGGSTRPSPPGLQKPSHTAGG